MRLPRPSTFAGVAVMATTIAVLPLTSASAAFDDGDYSLSEACDIDATLKVRGGGNGLSVIASTNMALVKSDDGAIVIEFGDAATADDNAVHTLSPAEEGADEDITCVTDVATDDEVAVLLGLEGTTNVDDFAAELSVDEASLDEAEDAVSADEAEKVTICHNVTNNPHDIEVSASALQAHLDHGDLEDECTEELLAEFELEREQARADRDAAKADRDADREAAQADRDAARADRDAARADKTKDEDDS